ncbi:MAG: YceI family protein [Chloroflexi bacterium]|nr:YceI family protein [Chloroflexota bacterium]
MHKQGLLSARILSLIALAALMLALLVAACGTGSESDDGDGETVESPTATATATAVPTVSAPDATPASEDDASTPEGGGSADVETPAGGLSAILQEGSLARYLIREELASVELPFDAIGETSEVSGAFTFSADGEIVPESSRIVLNAASLRSDEENRDRYLQRNAIQTATYPEIVFVATSVDGLEWPLPSSGDAEFTIYGDLTVREVTRPVAWQTVATFDGASVTGTAKTNFTFGEFEMEVPDLFFIISLEDNIRLELDFVAGW